MNLWVDEDKNVYFHEVLFGLMRRIFDLGDTDDVDNELALSYIRFRDYQMQKNLLRKRPPENSENQDKNEVVNPLTFMISLETVLLTWLNYTKKLISREVSAKK